MGLGQGAQVITLTVTDSELNTASASVRVYVDVPLHQIELPVILKP